MEQKYHGFKYTSVTLEDMLACREKRAEKSAALIAQNIGTVVCMTMNFVGEYKLLPLSHVAFLHFVNMIKLVFEGCRCETYHEPTGDTAFFVIDDNPQTVKAMCEKFEDIDGIGRLFDIDVFSSSGEKLSRNSKRKCLICSKPAAECARNRSHGVLAVRDKTIEILCDYFAKDNIIPMAYDALVAEVDTTPKPGLVDRNNSGANSDMDYDMFINSSRVIAPYMGDMFRLAALFESVDDTEFLLNIRNCGLEAEKAMKYATGGVNTHKGAIYLMGLLSAGMGYALAGGGTFTDAIDTAAHIALLLSEDVLEYNTHGIEVCRKYGVTGARGEAIGGFKTVLYAFERIKYYSDDLCLDSNTAFPLAICDIMSVMSDTNVLHRAGREGLDFLHKEAKEISQMRVNQRIDDLYDLDKDLIERNISPGGCADALACAIFLLKAEKLFTK